IKVDGYSMVPMLLPDSWVVFEETHEYQGDGLYILNFDNQLMVKLLQLNPINKILDIISVNKDYKSYSIDLRDSQVEIIIQGKVLRSII
ncbi:helix-turn-helix transcriptional regulator, partial [Campylobacter coli]|nr:helix-turn-helix transcriptional regulator [Campylobacter coli]